jgi:hypothetical protein
LTRTHMGVRLATVALAAIFLVSCAFNLGARLQLGSTVLAFSNPSSSIAEFEILIAALLLAAAILSSAYAFAGALLLATVGILEGLLNAGVQGQARELHESMIPFLLAGWILLAAEAWAGRKARPSTPSQSRRGLITALQFFVGALVTLGGAAFAEDGAYPIGTALGSVHLVVGILGLVGGYGVYKRKDWSKSYLVAINAVTIAYSAFAETLAEVYAYLPQGINDALIGTIVAIVVSAAIVYMVRKGPLWAAQSFLV